jgi:hypothetical protein|eukprot:COSAG01_NODE_11582_length_1899_cov_183.131667_3_plen_140_part_00
MDSIIAKVTDFNDMLVPELLAAGLNDQERIKSVRAPLEATVSTRAAVASDQVKEAVQGRQKELSRSIAPLVQAKMKPGYERGYAEAGTGSHRRRVGIVESHISRTSRTMFADAVHPVIESMAPLRQEIQRVVLELCVDK